MKDRAERASTAGPTGVLEGHRPACQSLEPGRAAAANVEAVGPGALGAVEATPWVSGETGLSRSDEEAARALVKRFGGVDALVGWLRNQADLR